MYKILINKHLSMKSYLKSNFLNVLIETQIDHGVVITYNILGFRQKTTSNPIKFIKTFEILTCY